jgi:hypothetical protein
MNVLELKAQIIEELDHVSEEVLLEIKQYLTSCHSAIPQEVINRIKNSQQQAIEGRGIPHDEAMKILNSWKER